MAIYKGDIKVAGGNIKLDGFLSDTSSNPVPNKVITSALEEVGYSTWQKPADWMDIRSATQPNSIYILACHSTDFSLYDYLAFTASVSSGDYDVFIDGVKYNTFTTATDCSIRWSTSSITTGFNTTYPSALRTHIIRITPATSGATITKFGFVDHASLSAETEYGVLWLHFSLTNNIDMRWIMTGGSAKRRFSIFEAFTATNNLVKSSNELGASFYKCFSLQTVPEFDIGTSIYTSVYTGCFQECSKLKRVKLGSSNSSSFSIQAGLFQKCFALKKIEFNGLATLSSSGNGTNMFQQCTSLEEIPLFDVSTVKNGLNFMTQLSALKDTFFDMTSAVNLTNIKLNGYSSDARMDGLKGLIVSNEAPFNGTSPQINVSYTGLTREALVNLFNSMPTVTGSQVCNVTGAIGAADLTASDLAIAVNKGWTITR